VRVGAAEPCKHSTGWGKEGLGPGLTEAAIRGIKPGGGRFLEEERLALFRRLRADIPQEPGAFKREITLSTHGWHNEIRATCSTRS